ncbi:unnamed protein product, partial [Didymodactylos carnosus]
KDNFQLSNDYVDNNDIQFKIEFLDIDDKKIPFIDDHTRLSVLPISDPFLIHGSKKKYHTNMDTTRKQTTASHRKTAVHESKTQFLQTLLQASITTRSLKSNGFSDDDRTQSYRVSDIDQQAAKLPQTSTNLKKKFYTKRQQDEPVISIQSNSNKLLEKNILTGSTTKNSNPLSSSARLSYKSDAMSQTDGITQLVQQNFLNHRSSTESSVAPVTTVPSPLPPPPAPPLPSLNIAKFESVQKPELHLPKSELISIVDGTMWGAVNKSLRGPQR